MVNHLSVILSAAAFSAAGLHFIRAGEAGMFAATLLFPLLFIFRRRWARNVVSAALWGGVALWMLVLLDIAQARILIGVPWARFALIMAAILTLTVLSAVLAGRFRCAGDAAGSAGDTAAFAAFIITAVLLVTARARAPFPILIADRLVDGAGWSVIVILSAYAAWITARMVESGDSAKLRMRIWVMFAVIFFAQLLLGLSGIDYFLMTGHLHVPVPAVVIAGPLYRGEGFFMPVLFASTVLLVGPAWCSHLCYFGAWDALAASKRLRPSRTPAWLPSVRWLILAGVVLMALLFRALHVPVAMAALAAVVFGVLGFGIIMVVSRRKGYMAQCTAWCPLGLVAALAGKLSPFRMRISADCSDCGMCAASCRYGALRPEHIRRRAPGPNCTLCGDCVASCRGESIGYRFPGLHPREARAAFIALIAALHAVFLGLARI